MGTMKRFLDNDWNGNSPDFALELEEEIVFEEGRILRLNETHPPDFAERMDEWIAKWGPELARTYS